jgi:hypothetical protein
MSSVADEHVLCDLCLLVLRAVSDSGRSGETSEKSVPDNEALVAASR